MRFLVLFLFISLNASAQSDTAYSRIDKIALAIPITSCKNTTEIANYFNSSYDYFIMKQSLKKNIVWANHNLVTDSVFAEVHLILCRNVLIYFDHHLQNKVQHLFYNSLINGGVLCLGSKESLRFTDLFEKYSELDKKQRIFKKKYLKCSMKQL